MDQDNAGTPNPIAPESAPTSNQPPVAPPASPEALSETHPITPPTPPDVSPETPPVASPQTETPPSAEATPVPQPEKPKTSKSLIALVIILTILTLAGIGTSVYFAIDANNKSTQISDLQSKLDSAKTGSNANSIEIEENDTTTSTIEPTPQATIDNNLAQNLVDPYLESLGYNNNILKNQFTEDIKALVSYANINPYYMDGNNISYSTLNMEYQTLFGNNAMLEQRTVNTGRTVALNFNPNTNKFEVEKYGSGGTGGSLFAIVKQANMLDDNIVVDVYSDTIPWCGQELGDNGGYCYDGEIMGIVTIGDGNMESIIVNQSNRIPVYQMKFTKDAGHYILTGIQKS